MGKEKRILIKEVDITNNCPECFNQDLKLSFYQKHTFNPFFLRITDNVLHEIKCKKCYSVIYPVNWTADIERVFDYYSKLVKPDKSSVRFTSLFFVLLVLLIGVVAGLVYLYLEGVI